MPFSPTLNQVITVQGRSQTGEDGGGQPIYEDVLRGVVAGRINARGGRGRNTQEVVNGPDLNPVISDFEGFTDIPAGFDILERDTVTDDTGAYEVLGVSVVDAFTQAHHLELSLRRIA